MNTPTDEQLKRALSKMLPEKLEYISFTMDADIENAPFLAWKNSDEVLDTELLHLCWLVEETLTQEQKREYVGCVWDWFVVWMDVPNDRYYQAIHATWQQRVIALAKVKGIEL